MTIARFEKAYGYKGVGRSGQGGQAALSLAGKQAGVLRSIVKQSVGPCKTEASQKPVHLDPRLVRTLRAWRRSAASVNRQTGFSPVLSAGGSSLSGDRPSCDITSGGCGKGGHPQTNRLAYLSTFVFDVAEGKWSRHKGHAGTASACVHTRDTGHVHSGCNAGAASGSNRGRHTVLSQREDRLGKRPLNQGWELLRRVVTFCAYEFSGKRLEVVGSKLASPMGFEPVLPP